MCRHRLIPLVAILLLVSCKSEPRQGKEIPEEFSRPQGAPLLSDNLKKGEPTKKNRNTTGRTEPLGDLLSKLSSLDPKHPELAWFRRLNPPIQQQVVLELNQFNFQLIDNLEVKTRMSGDYDLRWRFTDVSPTRVAIESQPQHTVNTQSVQVAVRELRTVEMPPNSNDQRSFHAHITWQINPNSPWAKENQLPEAPVSFTIPFNYSADCEIIDRVPRRVESLSGIESLELLRDGSVRMTCSPDRPKNDELGLNVRMSLNGRGQLTTLIAKPGDSIGIYLPDAIGAGAGGYTFLGTHDGLLRFERLDWFYEIVPATREVIEVRPYTSPSDAKTPATTRPK